MKFWLPAIGSNGVSSVTTELLRNSYNEIAQFISVFDPKGEAKSVFSTPDTCITSLQSICAKIDTILPALRCILIDFNINSGQNNFYSWLTSVKTDTALGTRNEPYQSQLNRVYTLLEDQHSILRNIKDNGDDESLLSLRGEILKVVDYCVRNFRFGKSTLIDSAPHTYWTDGAFDHRYGDYELFINDSAGDVDIETLATGPSHLSLQEGVVPTEVLAGNSATVSAGTVGAVIPGCDETLTTAFTFSSVTTTGLLTRAQVVGINAISRKFQRIALLMGRYDEYLTSLGALYFVAGAGATNPRWDNFDDNNTRNPAWWVLEADHSTLVGFETRVRTYVSFLFQMANDLVFLNSVGVVI